MLLLRIDAIRHARAYYDMLPPRFPIDAIIMLIPC